MNHVLTGYWPNLDQHFNMCLFVDQASEVLLSDVMTGRPDEDHLKQGVHDQRQERLLTNIGARSPPKVNAGEICISHPSHCWWGGTSCLPREGEDPSPSQGKEDPELVIPVLEVILEQN